MAKKIARNKRVRPTEYDDDMKYNTDYHMSQDIQKTYHQSSPQIDFDTLTTNQNHYLTSIKSDIITFGIGCAGTGKSYVAVMYAAQQLKNRKYKKLIITRPAVECGEKFGYMPGPQPLDAKIVTPNGWTTMGDLNIGDDVIASDGNKTKVIGIFPKGKKMVYRITTEDGTSTEACADHLWYTYVNNNGSIKSTQEIINTLTNNHYLPRNKAVHYDNIGNLSIIPYIINEQETFIPDLHKYSSIENRLNLIRSICVCDNDNIFFNATSIRLINDVIEVIRSLGGITSLVEIGNSYEISIILPENYNPFYTSQEYSDKVGIISIEPIGIKEVQCIKIEHESHLYLTNDFIVTHNTIEEKYEEYLTPIKSILHKGLGHNYTELLIKNKVIEPRPLAFMRGSTFEDTIVILDEAQNITPEQMVMFLTRIGNNCKVIVNGDINQKDIRGESGLKDAVNRLRYVSKVGVVEFTIDDIVRSGIVRDILIAYQKKN